MIHRWLPRRAPALVLAALLFAVPASALAAADPYVGNGEDRQWHLDRVNAIDAWATTRGGGGIVAVVDTGVRLSHEDLADRILRNGQGQVIGRDFVDGDNSPNDEQGHGTLVAGLIAATEGNGLGGAGVGPRLRIMPIRVLDEDGAGEGSDVSAAIRWAADRGADVINLSLECSATGIGGSLDGLACSTLGGAPEDAVNYAASKGAVVVAAAGNDGSSFTDYGENSPVLLVGATDRDDVISNFSDRGRDDVVVAPGEEIVSTWCKEPPPGATAEEIAALPCDRNDTYGESHGTSFSAPQVAAAVAMLMAGGLSGPQAVARVRATARDLGNPGRDSTYGYGLLDVAAAVAVLDQPDPTPTQPSPAPTSPDPDPTTQPPAPNPTTNQPQPGPPTGSPTATPGPTVAPSPSPTSEPSPTASPTEDSVIAGTLEGDRDQRPQLIAVALLLLAVAAQVGWRVSEQRAG